MERMVLKSRNEDLLLMSAADNNNLEKMGRSGALETKREMAV